MPCVPLKRMARNKVLTSGDGAANDNIIVDKGLLRCLVLRNGGEWLADTIQI